MSNNNKKKKKKQQPKHSEPEKNAVQEAVVTEATTEKESEDNKPEPQSETPDKKEESYSIYEFLKKDTKVLIAVVSAMVTVIIAILKYALYMYHIGYMSYWKVDPKFISSESYRLEDIGISFVFLVAGVIYIFLSNYNFDVLKKRKDSLKPLKERKKKNEKELKTKNKEKNKLLKNKKNVNDISDKIEKLKSQDEDIKKEIKKRKKDSKSEFFGNFIISSLIFSIIIYIFLLRYIDFSDNQKELILAMSIFLIFFPMFISIIYFALSKIILAIKKVILAIKKMFIRIFNSKSNKKDMQNDNNRKNDNKSELSIYPIKKIANMEIRSFFSNKNIFIAAFFILISSICMSWIEYEQGWSDAENLKDHICVTTIDNTNYAIIAQDSDNIIVERIDIKDEKATTATVYCNEQILIPKKNIEMKVYSFEKVAPREKDDEDMTEEDTA